MKVTNKERHVTIWKKIGKSAICIAGDQLSYYDNEDENHLKGTIDVHGAMLRVTKNNASLSPRPNNCN